MHFFKYGSQGEVLAIVLPPRIRKNAAVKEGDEYEFIEITPGAFLLVDRQGLSENKAQLLAKIAEKLFEKQDPTDFKPAVETAGKKESELKPIPPLSAGKKARKSEWEKEIEARGFVVVDEGVARELSQQLEYQIKSGEIMGVRGFDKKFYIASRSFYDSTSSKIIEAKLAKEFQLQDAAAATKTPEAGCLAVLQIMREGGELLEKKRGVFRLVK